MESYEDDYSWVPSTDDVINFVVGAKYHIKSGNNWETYTYVGYDPKHTISSRDQEDGLTYPVYIFQAEHGKSFKSEGYVKDLVSRGLIRSYGEDFSYSKELNIKKVNIDGIRPNFVIIFENGVDVEETYGLQERLLKMGYTWYSKGKRLITPKDVKDKIFTIESVNWDISNNLYSRMDATFGDRKILMMSTFENLKTENDKERRLNFILDHPQVQVIDGDNLLTKI